MFEGRPGKCADPTCWRGTAGKPEEDHNTIHDQIREGQSSWNKSSTNSVSKFKYMSVTAVYLLKSATYETRGVLAYRLFFIVSHVLKM